MKIIVDHNTQMKSEIVLNVKCKLIVDYTTHFFNSDSRRLIG